MRKFVVKFAVLALAVLIASPVWAAKEEKKNKGAAKAVAKAFELPTEITLTAEQQTKLADVKKEFEPKLQEVVKKQNEILTPEQKKARQEAMKTAKAAGKKGKELQADVAAAVKLTDEQKKKQEEVGKELKDLNGKVREQISGFLTAEQKVHLKTKKKNKNA
jgi:hypothetical protein